VIGTESGIKTPEKDRNVRKAESQSFNGPEDAGIPVGHSRRDEDQVGAVHFLKAPAEGLLGKAEMTVMSGHTPIGLRLFDYPALRDRAAERPILLGNLMETVEKGDVIAPFPEGLEQTEETEGPSPEVEKGEVEDRRIHAQNRNTPESQKKGRTIPPHRRHDACLENGHPFRGTSGDSWPSRHQSR
jgi:hypothetical protein